MTAVQIDGTTGNVGIGTSSPASMLSVYRASGTNPGITVGIDGTGTNDSATLSYITKGDGNTGLNNAATKGWHWYARSDAYSTASGQNDLGLHYYTGTTGSSVLYFDAPTGNVGFGTTTPTGRLHVQGSANRYVVVDGAKANTTIRCDDNSTQCAGDPHLVLENRSITSVNTGLTLGFNIARSAAAGDQAGSIRVLAESDWSSAANKDSYMSLHTMLNGTAGEKVRVTADGNVGIGLTNPTAKLQVAGQIVSNQTTIATGATVNFANGNTQVLNAPGGAAITLQNMVHGASYTLVITDTATPRTYTFTGCNASYFNPANGNTLAGTRSVYTILAIQNGANTDCYISWITGFQ